MLQELIERYAHDGHMHWELLVSAPFLAAWSPQLPFALLAAAIAYALTVTARAIAERSPLAAAQARSPPAPASIAWPGVDLPRRAGRSPAATPAAARLCLA